jgi:hypothetical protein
MMRLILFRGMKEAAHTGTDDWLCMARDIDHAGVPSPSLALADGHEADAFYCAQIQT